MEYLKENLSLILNRIKESTVKINRNPQGITLVAVTKTVPLELIKEAISLGITDIGENKVQEALQKYPQIEQKIRWHLIGHLQTNKVKFAVKLFDLIHSVDSLKIAQEINNQAQKINKTQNILLEVNISGEETKFGLKPEEVIPLLKEINILPDIKILGLMTMAPLVEDAEKVRPVFRRLKELFEEIKNTNIPNIEMRYLSMGMTQDFEVAIEEGANVVRIGTGIFGKRQYL